MRRAIVRLRPSPAMAVAFVALLVAIGGTAAALPGKNTVTSDDIAKGAVKNSDIGRGAVTAKSIRRRSLDGTDIKINRVGGNAVKEEVLELNKLGKVPTAAKADTAGFAGFAGSAGSATTAGSAGAVDGLKPIGFKRVSSSASNASADVAREAATEVPLLSFGPFEVYGKCFTNTTGPSTIAMTYIRTSQSGSVIDPEEDNFSGAPGEGFLDTDTVEDDREVVGATASANDALDNGDADGVFSAAAPDGTVFTGQINVFVKNGTLPGGDGIYGAGNVCIFFGHGIAG